MNKNIFLLILCLFLINLNYAQIPVLTTSVEGIKEFKLPNDLKILLIPDASQSNVVVNIVYGVGSRHEGYGESGMAHLLEHILFKRSSKFTDIKKAIADKGARANGTTWYDRTNYYEILPATDENLKWALEMEADRMITSAILQSDLDTEFSVVRNEFEIGENNPARVLRERILSTSYLWHNYGKSTIGSKEDIERVPASRLKKFYEKFYQPNNATLIIGGKFDEKKTLNWISEYFAKIPKSKIEIEKTYTIEPVQDGERFVELKRNGDIQYLATAYHTPSYSDKDYSANNAIISILTNNPSGILYKNLVETKLATKIYGYAQPLRDPGFSYFECEIPKDNDIIKTQTAFLETLNQISQMKFTEEDLKRAKNELLKDFENTYNKTINLSIALTEYIGAGDWRLFFLQRDNIENLTLLDIQNAAKKYYLTSNRTWGKFIPDTNPQRTQVAEIQDIENLIKDYKGKKMQENTETFESSVANILKSSEEGKLNSGAKYILLEKPTKGDKIEARILMRMGDEKTLSNQSLIADLTSQILMTGTKNRTKDKINDELDQLKTSLSLSAEVDGLYIKLSTDKTNLSKALDLTYDILKNPSFDSNEFDKIKLEMKGDLESDKNDPRSVASEKLTLETQLYPKNHPYSAFSTDEKLSKLSSITLDQVKKYYTDFYGGNSTYSSFIGGIDKNIVKTFLTKTFDNWKNKITYQRIETKYFDVKSDKKTIQINDKTNAVALGKINLSVGKNNPDFPAIDMANELLGGGAFLSSRIPQRLREAEGMSYGAGSYLSGNEIDNTGSWGVYAFFNPTFKDKLDEALKQEITKAIDKGFTKEEFESSLKSWLQTRQTALGTDNFLVTKLRDYLEIGKNIQEYKNHEDKVKALNVNQINQALKKYFDINKFVLIYTGDFNKK